MVMDINEIKEKIAFWQKIEDEDGSPTSKSKLAAFSKMLEEAEAAAKPVKKAKKEEPVVDDWNEDDAVVEADEEE